MATYKLRGTSHCIIFPYRDENAKKKQQWETYTTELEAIQRKAQIDILQRTKAHAEILKEVNDYKCKRNIIKNQQLNPQLNISQTGKVINTDKTYTQFVEKWLPIHITRNRFSPNTYDTYIRNLKNHIFPYFGDRIMNTISSEDIDNFLHYLSDKRVMGSQSYNKLPHEVPTLSSATVKKCYDIFMAGFPIAKAWNYIIDIPLTKPPIVKSAKTKAWSPDEFADILPRIDDKITHLIVNLAFNCSLREGEVAGIDIRKINIKEQCLWIDQEVQRVSDESLEKLPENEIIRVFPKTIKNSISSLILKAPKNEKSTRKLYLPPMLCIEIAKRISIIEDNKAFLKEDYNDNNLLICHPDGRPYDPKSIGKSFKKTQDELKIENKIDFQGLRKSGQMHKIRISDNNYQLVASNGGHAVEVLLEYYDEALELEKRNLAMKVENNILSLQGKNSPVAPVESTKITNVLYHNQSEQPEEETDSAQQLVNELQKNPMLKDQIMQLLGLNAPNITS